ncbi:hypothetical protein B0H63DRAFT_458298 [Podospora didyma]|uniref:Uncharacterized protein n=1 Tax=Podospora didyma TaxID=330526 RepID=A0AAE0U789_9PEZI|nr:hypothetical protein B0H63DRAFT_458298 [Podospora didyma]
MPWASSRDRCRNRPRAPLFTSITNQYHTTNRPLGVVEANSALYAPGEHADHTVVIKYMPAKALPRQRKTERYSGGGDRRPAEGMFGHGWAPRRRSAVSPSLSPQRICEQRDLLRRSHHTAIAFFLARRHEFLLRLLSVWTPTVARQCTTPTIKLHQTRYSTESASHIAVLDSAASPAV